MSSSSTSVLVCARMAAKAAVLRRRTRAVVVSSRRMPFSSSTTASKSNPRRPLLLALRRNNDPAGIYMPQATKARTTTEPLPRFRSPSLFRLFSSSSASTTEKSSSSSSEEKEETNAGKPISTSNDSSSSTLDEKTSTTTAGAASAASSSASKKDEDEKKEAAAEEPAAPPPEEIEFQADTRQLLDIVTHSLYTDKEVFLRELVSNASDALEKLRHLQSLADNKAGTIMQPDLPLEIRIDIDEVTGTISIADTGIGMTRDELVKNLGTIARSGSKNFVREFHRMKAAGHNPEETTLDPSQGIIGKFGVGFYSSFMVSEKVQVRSQPALIPKGGEEEGEQPVAPKVWTSDGSGTFEISDLPGDVRQDRGSCVVLYVEEAHWSFVDEKRIEKILKRYSNFVNFPIYLNGTLVNTQEAIWSKDPKEVKDTEYDAFYKYIANAVDVPMVTYHFRADAPLEVKALFFVPSFHAEKYGMGRMDPGVNLYSRKVLIEAKSPDILPEWMRFVKGVVDSEDLPLSISREKAQDSALIAKLRRVLTRKFIVHLTKMAERDRSEYLIAFYKEYSFFVKEGICQDYEFQSQLSKLLYYETSKNVNKDVASLDEYVSRMRPEQKDIYYIVSPNRKAALDSPYLEAFDKTGVEVLFMYNAIDDFVMANLAEYEGRKLVSVEQGDIDLPTPERKQDGSKDTSEEGGSKEEDESDGSDGDGATNMYQTDRELSAEEIIEFCSWFRREVGEDRVASCTATKRLTSSPAIVTDNESGHLRRMMRMVDASAGGDTQGQSVLDSLPKQHVEINPRHEIIAGAYRLSKTGEHELARVVAEQVFDNCLVAAGILDDGRSMLPRLNDILLCVVKGAQQQNQQNSQEQELSPEEPPEVVVTVEEESSKTEKSAAERDQQQQQSDEEGVAAVQAEEETKKEETSKKQ